MKFIIVAASALLAASACSAAPTGVDASDQQWDAERVCKDFVKDRLKSPASADFSDITTTGAAGRYEVAGSVDSENSFGAMIRNTFTCKVHLDATGEQWILDRLGGLAS